MQQSPAELVIVHLLSSSRNVGSDGGLSSQELRTGMAQAASQLGVLSSAQAGNTAELAAELHAKARGLLNSKQAATRRQGLELASSAIACCDRRAFLASQLDWFAAVTGLLRGEQDAAVAAAGWACLATLFSRLQRMLDVPGVRRDGATMIPKLVALLQQRFPSQQAAAGAAAEGPRTLAAEPAALRALLAAATALPAPFRQHLKYLEPLLTGMLTQPGLPAGAVRLAAACVAALPRVNGDGSSWSAMAQRLLASCHCLLDTVLLGLEDQGLVGTARELLDPQAQPLPGLPPPSPASLASYKAAFGQLEAVGEALQALLTASYPSPVPLPSMGLLLLVARVLGVDDASGRGKATGTKFGELCLRLPALHALALRLLCTLLRAARAQLAPLYLTTARLLGEYLGRVAGGGAGALTPTSPKVRAQLYEATQLLLLSGGIGMTRTLGPALLACARTELYGGGPAAAAAGVGKGAGGSGEQQPAKKRRRSKGQGGAVAGEGEEAIGCAPNDDAGALTARLNLSAQAGVLGALEALLTCGAALLAQPDRDQADAIAAHMASTTAAAAQKLSQDSDGDTSHLAPLQLAAYRALLAAVLAPLDHRPAHLPLALALFRGGLRGGAAELGVWCSQALLCCEALLHPRAAPHPAPLRPLTASAGAAGGGAFGFGGAASAGAAGLGPDFGSAGAEDGERAGLGRPLFWSYLDAAASSGAAVAVGGAAAGGVAAAEAVDGAAAGAGSLQQQAQQAEQGWGGDIEMAEPAGAEPGANGALLAAAPLLQQQPAGPAAASGLVAAAQQAQQAQQQGQQQAQQAQRQQVSSMAAMMMGGASAAPAAAVPAMPAGAAPAPTAALPAATPAPAAAAALAGGTAAAQPQPPAAAPVPLGGGRAAGAAAAAPAAGRLALAGGEDSDSDGPLPDIDSGGEDSESEDESEGADE